MAQKKETQVSKPADQSALVELTSSFPMEEGFQSVSLPRITFASQDVTEKVRDGGKTRLEVVTEAGTFFREYPTKEIDETTGRPVWAKDELGNKIDVHIIYQRKLLKFFDSSSQSFITSNVYDQNDEVVKLYSNRTEIATGTPDELKKSYEVVDNRTGKTKSDLQDYSVLYVLLDGELHQMTIRGSSRYSWLTYQRQVRPGVPAFITEITSTPESNGSNDWNKMVFINKRLVTADEAQVAKDAIAQITQDIARRQERAQNDREFDEHQSNQAALPAGNS